VKRPQPFGAIRRALVNTITPPAATAQGAAKRHCGKPLQTCLNHASFPSSTRFACTVITVVFARPRSYAPTRHQFKDL
jgi:hypothetical protein